MAVFDDDMTAVQTIAKHRLDSDRHRRPGFAHANEIEGVILVEIIGAVGDTELIPLTLHVRANSFTGVDRLQGSLENQMQMLSQLFSALHGLPSSLLCPSPCQRSIPRHI